jgi:transmembrane sensor
MIDHHLIIKYFSGKANPEEASAIESWAQEATANKEWLMTWHQAWLNDTDTYQQPSIEQEWQKFEQQIKMTDTAIHKAKPKMVTLWLTRIAAAVLFLMTGYGGYYMFNTHNQNVPTYLAEAGYQVDTVLLQDGSIVYLQPNSQLAYPQEFDTLHRSASLVGNAIFHIAPKEHTDFIIDLGQAKIKVMGTAFEVIRDKKTIEVVMQHGQVAFFNKKDTLYLSNKQRGLFTIKTKQFQLLDSTIDTVATNSAPILGSFLFNNTPLSEVVTQLNNHYKVNITLQSSLQHCKLSAGIDQQPLNIVLEIIAATHHVTYQQEEKNIIISGSGCTE